VDNPIADVPKEEVKDDFILTIWVEETTLRQGENFVVNVELRNDSGEDHEIARYFLFYPDIPKENWRFQRIQPLWPTFELFKNNNIISQTINLNHYYELSQGVYQLTVKAKFFLDWEQPENPENEPAPWEVPDNARQINISSNTIEITVR